MTTTLGTVVKRLRDIAGTSRDGGLNDGALLERFAKDQDQAAFEVLLWRHGPMVLGVCQRLLRVEQDREDAFQATFLTLARKAGSIANREAVASWLYKVAYRVALDARHLSSRIALHEKNGLELSAAGNDSVGQIAQRELYTLLDAAIQRLPRKYRDPVVLCYLEGKSQDEAGRELGWAKGTVSTRLIRARELLRQRLQRHGNAFSTSMLVPVLARRQLPSVLVRRTLSVVVTNPAPVGATSAQAALLAEAAVRNMAACSLKRIFLPILVLALGAGVGWLSYGHNSPVDPATQPEQIQASGPRQQAKASASGLARLDSGRIPPEERFDWQPPELVAVIGEHRGRSWAGIRVVALSPDGTSAASAGDDRLIHVWDAATLRERATLRLHTLAIYSLAFAPDGKTLVSGGEDKRLAFWDLTATPPTLKAVRRHDDIVSALAFTPDGRTLACTGVKEAIRLYDVAEGLPGESFATLTNAHRWTNALAISRDGTLLASTGSEERKASVALWDLRTRTRFALLPTELQQVWSVAISPDGLTLACCGDDFAVMRHEAILWDIADRTNPRKKATVASKQSQLLKVRFAPDGKTLLAGSMEGLRSWNLSGVEPMEQRNNILSNVHSFDLSSDGNRLIAGGWMAMRAFHKEGARWAEEHPSTGHMGPVTNLALSRTGVLAVCDGNQSLRLWDLSGATPLPRASLKGNGPVAISADGNTLADDHGDATVAVWDLRPATPIKRFQTSAHKLASVFGIQSLAFLPDDRTLACSGVDSRLRFWDLTGSDARMKNDVQLKSSCCSISDSWVAAYGADWSGKKDPNLWQPSPDVRLCEMIGTAIRERAVLHCNEDVAVVAFSPDGRSLVTAGGSHVTNVDPSPAGELRIWRLDGSSPSSESVRLGEDLEPLDAVAFSPDGQILASSGFRGQVILWETATGKKYREWQLPGAVHDVKFSYDGRHLITANGNGTAYVLRLRATHPPRSNAALWQAFGADDATKAYQAMWTMIAEPSNALGVLRQHLTPTPPSDPGRIQQLIERLDGAQFKDRVAATKALEELQDLAEPALRRHLAAGKPSLEARNRIEEILRKVKAPSGEQLRSLRAIQVLEQIGDRDAQEMLRVLGTGAPGSRVTEHAQAAWQRLRKM
jgi:RNA polymerase sigma factor (sigma-70 family)